MVAAAVMASLVACKTFDDEAVPIAYAPAAGPTLVPGAEKVTLSVSAEDRRAQKDRIGIKSSINQPRILADSDITQVVRGAVQGELRGEGFVIGSGGLAVTIYLQDFYYDASWENLHGSGISTVAFALRVRDRAGATLYGRTYEAKARLDFNFDKSTEKARVGLQRALADAVRQVADDKALQAALLRRNS
jgi:uncharacterized lipoprotein YajG